MIDWTYIITTPEFFLGVVGLIVLAIGAFMIKFGVTFLGIVVLLLGLLMICYSLYGFYHYVEWVGLTLIPTK